MSRHTKNQTGDCPPFTTDNFRQPRNIMSMLANKLLYSTYKVDNTTLQYSSFCARAVNVTGQKKKIHLPINLL